MSLGTDGGRDVRGTGCVREQLGQSNLDRGSLSKRAVNLDGLRP